MARSFPNLLEIDLRTIPGCSGYWMCIGIQALAFHKTHANWRYAISEYTFFFPFS